MKKFFADHNVPTPNWVDGVALVVIISFIVAFFRKRK